MKTIKIGNYCPASLVLLLLIAFSAWQCKPLRSGSGNRGQLKIPNEQMGLYLGEALLIRQSFEEAFNERGQLQLISHLDTLISFRDTVKVRPAGDSQFRVRGRGVVSEINQWENEVYAWSPGRKYEAGVDNPGYYSNRLKLNFGPEGKLDIDMNIQIHRTDQPRNWTKLEFKGRHLPTAP